MIIKSRRNDMNEPIPTRQSLLSRLKDWNDQESWRDFFETYWRLIYQAAIKAGLTETEAQDAVQETIISVSKSMRKFEYNAGSGSFKGWLLQLTRWRIDDQFRKRQRGVNPEKQQGATSTRTSTLERIPDPAGMELEATWDQEWDRNLMEVAIDRVKQKVDPKLYQIFDLYAIKEWPVTRVARALHVNPGKVYLAKHRISSLIKKELARLQIIGNADLDYSWCLTSKEFGKQAILSDLLYFKYYFLDTLQIPYDKEKLIDDFEGLSTYLSYADHKYFMFRDFQSRNIFIQDDKVHFIDYQGGMKGALQYDVASMLWQAKAELPDEWKNDLLNYYMDCAEEILIKPIDRVRFVSQYNGYVLIRLLQVLGAYGFRGLFERKAHFLISIPLALKNLKWFMANKQVGIVLPEFDRLLRLIVEDQIISRFEPLHADEHTPLVVHINSFSYKKSIPNDLSGNGGGFVFDCRGILNPGRIDSFKTKTGRDKEVKDFLEQDTRMPEFLNSVYDLVDITVEDYIKRGFSSLLISFGCTGGQHRSVYAADALSRHLRNKFKVRIDLHHLVQEEKDWVNG